MQAKTRAGSPVEILNMTDEHWYGTYDSGAYGKIPVRWETTGIYFVGRTCSLDLVELDGNKLLT